MAEQLLTIEEARQRLGGISRVTLLALRKSGELKDIEIGSRKFIAESDLEAYIESKRMRPGENDAHS